MRWAISVYRSSQKLAPCCSRLQSTFRYKDLQIELTDDPKPKPDMNTVKFGNEFSDHMLEIDWSQKHGWSRPIIRKLTEFQIHPAAKVFHYAPELYEGLKAYRCVDGKIRIFRPMENMKRMIRTAERGSLPTFEMPELIQCIKKLITIDQEWVPYTPETTLYVRPAMIGIDAALGINTPTEVKLFVITSPVGLYYPSGLKPISLYADPEYVRAWPGGSGEYKLGSNYAATVAIQNRATAEQGCTQVLWLYGEDHLMTEVGTMNLFVYWVNEQGVEELATPTLETGVILPGITRKSLIELTREWGEFQVTETELSMKRFVKAINEGRVKEVFGSGTACVVAPVDRIKYMNQDLNIPSEAPNGQQTLAQRLYDELLDIQFYKKPHPWMETIEE